MFLILTIAAGGRKGTKTGVNIIMPSGWELGTLEKQKFKFSDCRFYSIQIYNFFFGIYSNFNIEMVSEETACLTDPGGEKILLRVNPVVSNSIWANPNLTRCFIVRAGSTRGLMKSLSGLRLL